MRKSKTDNGWLQPVLRRGLRRVSAPRELWDRVTLPRLEEVRPEPPRRTFMWSIAGASVVAASLFTVAWGYYPSSRVGVRSGQAAAREAYTISVQRPTCLGCHVEASI